MSDFKHSIPKKIPNPIDVQVGLQIKLRRKTLGISQSALASELGVTFQQVQKYEKGANRVGASRLKRIAECLEMPVSRFFDCDLIGKASDDVTLDFPESDLNIFLVTAQGITLNKAFGKLQPSIKKRILAVVKAISDADDDAK